jgi:hypothetical protein
VRSSRSVARRVAGWSGAALLAAVLANPAPVKAQTQPQ